MSEYQLLAVRYQKDEQDTIWRREFPLFQKTEQEAFYKECVDKGYVFVEKSIITAKRG
ncbi:hypothetical protein AB3N02_21810 [Priestia aryabhattai]|uniref:hypothetical protein n=1 Tax=Priestia aryabhattai TaxID=412384 RepID=UPI0039A2FEA7